jgi:hypothetical protein
MHVDVVGHGCGPDTLQFVGTMRYTMEDSAAIVVVLTMMRNTEMVVLDDQCISMAHLEF